MIANRRKTIREIINAKQKGLRCDRCGCRDFRVRDTKRVRNSVRRYRFCRNCNAPKITIEMDVVDMEEPRNEDA